MPGNHKSPPHTTQHHARTHAVTNPLQVLEHFRDSKTTRFTAGRTKSIKDGGVALERVEGIDRFAV